VKGETEFLILDPFVPSLNHYSRLFYHCEPGEKYNCTFCHCERSAKSRSARRDSQKANPPQAGSNLKEAKLLLLSLFP